MQDFYEAYFGHPRDEQPSDEFAKLTVNYLYGTIYARENEPSLTTTLDLRDRALVNVALLAAFGWREELRQHLVAAFHQGLGHDFIVELLIHVAHYAGWPAGHSAMKILDDAARARGVPQTSRTEDYVLRELNENVAKWEQRRDAPAIEALDLAVSSALVFKRADQTVVGKSEFMQGLERPSPYTERRSESISVHTMGSRALATLTVVTTKPGGEVSHFRNIRFLARRDGRWQIESWFNEEVAG